MRADNFYFDLNVMKEVRAHVPINIAQIARQTYDKYGTVFPCLDHSDWIDGIDVSNNAFNTVFLSFGFPLYNYVDFRCRRDRALSYDYTSRIERMVDKMCQLKLI